MFRPIFINFILIIIFILLSNVSKAFCSPIIPLSLDRLSIESQIILHGKVISKKVQRDDAGRIFTKVSIDVWEIWKGETSVKPFILVHSGGILGDEKASATDEVSFKIGEEVVLFMIFNSRGEGVSMAMNQGKFDVFQDARSKLNYVKNPFHGGLPKALSKRAYRFPTQVPLTLSALKERVIQHKK